MTKITPELEQFYNENQDHIEDVWSEHISIQLTSGGFGSGEDRIRINDDMFWEFVEDLMDKNNV